jgi:hypothetical protein
MNSRLVFLQVLVLGFAGFFFTPKVLCIKAQGSRVFERTLGSSGHMNLTL